MNQSVSPCWEHFHHGADIGVRGIGATPAQAFEQAAVALMAVVTEPSTVEPLEQLEVTLDAPDLELLLADWLNALIYEMATRQMLFSAFDVAIEACHLRGTACGEAIDPTRHERTVEVKGATYTALDVSQDDDGQWIAQCVVDV